MIVTREPRPRTYLTCAPKLAEHGLLPVGVEVDELKKGGGSVKCCVPELRG